MGKILIVDDNPTDAKLLAHLFKRLPYTTLIAQSFRECREVLLKESEIIVIFQDLNLPDDPIGDTTARWCREHRPEVPLVIITGYEDLKRRIELADIGAVFFLTKKDRITSIDIQPILNIIDNVEAAYRKGLGSNRSWRTTICGLIVLASAVFAWWQTRETATTIALFFTAVGLLVARDEKAAQAALRFLGRK